MGLVRPLFPSDFTRPSAERRKTLTSHPTPLRWTGSGSLALLVTRAMVIGGGPNTAGVRSDRPGPQEPTEKPRPSGTAVYDGRPQGRPIVVSRRQPIRRGSEQWIAGHLSLDGLRGGEGNRDSPVGTPGNPGCPTIRNFVLRERRHRAPCSLDKNFDQKTPPSVRFTFSRSSARSLSLRLRSRSVPGNRLPFPGRAALTVARAVLPATDCADSTRVTKQPAIWIQ